MTEQIPLLDVDPYARHEDDFYATPAWMTRALLRRLPSNWSCQHGRVIEPCAGDGAIVRELQRARADLDVLTNDIVARRPMLPEFLLDARKLETWQAFGRTGRLDLVITNPPFDVAFDIAVQAYEAVTLGMVLLLRLSWLEPTDDRGPWLKLHPPTRQITLPRYDWRGDGRTDSVTSAWFLWAKQAWLCTPGFDTVTKAERDALIGVDAKERL